MIKTVDELAHLAIESLIVVGGKFGSERVLVLKQRLGLSGVNRPTLEECGQKLNLTRERVRQLEIKVKKDTAEVARDLDQTALDIAVDAMHDARSADEIARRIFLARASLAPTWGINQIRILAELLGRHDVMIRLIEVEKRLSVRAEEQERFASRVREVSDDVGFVPIDVLFAEFPWLSRLSHEAVLEILEQHFPIVVMEKDVVFAPRALDNSGFRAVREQLAVANNHQLGIAELFEGLKADQKGRSGRILHRPEEVVRCIVKCCPDLEYDERTRQVRLSGIEVQTTTPVEGTIAKRLIAKFLVAQQSMIHKLDLFEWVINEGMKPQSAQNTWSYDSRIRQRGNVLHLVGNYFDEELAGILEAAARVRFSRLPYFDYSHHHNGGSLQMNPLWISSGTVFVEQSVGQLLPLTTRVECHRGGCDATFGATRTESGNVLRLGNHFVAHLIESHRVGSMDWIPFTVRDGVIFLID